MAGYVGGNLPPAPRTDQTTVGRGRGLMSRTWERTPKTVQQLRPYDGEIAHLKESDIDFFEARYEVTPHGYIARAGYRYALPILSPDGSRRGIVIRKPWVGSPLSRTWAAASDIGSKAYTFVEKLGPIQSWHVPDYADYPNILLVLEDQLSAIKAAEVGIPAVAILGVPEKGKMDMPRVRELSQYPAKEVIVAFDADATSHALNFVREWGMAFKKIRVAILNRDIKDTLKADISEVLGL